MAALRTSAAAWAPQSAEPVPLLSAADEKQMLLAMFGIDLQAIYKDSDAVVDAALDRLPDDDGDDDDYDDYDGDDKRPDTEFYELPDDGAAPADAAGAVPAAAAPIALPAAGSADWRAGVPCRGDAGCTNPKCSFQHPAEWAHAVNADWRAGVPCRGGAGCANPKCGFGHPTTRRVPGRPPSDKPANTGWRAGVPCRDGAGCPNPKCSFQHPAGWPHAGSR